MKPAAGQIDLVALNSQQALNCAVPVLQFDRTSEESNYSIQSLKDALQSPSVREIMTTPLQSHIMAVVVRDGGRPPDRKWRLFSNFYQVIKKREANRNLTDKKLSQILHSGDKLIKALHNRLGFELHARAEQSKGAQTSIARDELAKIVRETVSDLQSTNIEETVAILMEATTARLVLVNTPESGEYVRFDIRPLQEFFAAEYLYEDISADHLGERLAIIAGDSHWREVMHFLLSALVENSRRTDLAVAVDRLANLDVRPDGSPARHFYRRLASGAVIATRLLTEGVLDQDQRVRQQFKRCLEPIFGSVEIGITSVLANVCGHDAASWLIDILADTLADQSESESIGAAYVLCLLMPNGHARQAEIETVLHARSAAYKACLFTMLAVVSEDTWEADFRPQEYESWVARLALQTLAAGDWPNLGEEGIRSAFNVIARHRKRLVEIAIWAGLDPSFSDLLPALLVSLDLDQLKPSHVENWDGIFDLKYFAPDAKLDQEHWGDELRNSIAHAPGIFSLVRHTFAVSSGNPSPDSLSVLEKAGELLNALPGPWREFVPLELPSEDHSKVAVQKSSPRPTSPSWQFKPGYICDMRYLGLDKGGDFERLLDHHAEWGLRVCGLLFGADEESAVAKDLIAIPAFAKKIGELCLKNPKAIAFQPETWGRFVKNCSPDSGIREALILSAAEWTPSRRFGEICPFELDLPKQVSLLPPLIHVITSKEPDFIYHRYLQRKQRTMSELARDFVPTIHVLIQVLNDDAQRPDIRGAAAMMCLLHPDCTAEQRNVCLQVIVSDYEPLANSWYLSAAASALTKLVGDDDKSAIEVMGRLLRAGTTDFKSKLRLSHVFETWRQKSKAPVSRHGIANF